MAQLKAKLATSGTATGPSSSSSSKRSVSQAPAPERRPVQSQQEQQAASFQGVSLQLGELGNPLQSMAVLTHTDVRQLEEYGSSPLASDQRFLASLQKMAAVPQQRAAGIMQMAAGAVPAPAVLVWAAQEVVVRLQQLVGEALAQQAAAGSAGGAAAALVSEPWYDGALQLARLTTASHLQPAQSPKQPPPPQQQPPRTELELLRAFAADPAGVSSPGSTPGPQQEQQRQPQVVAWEALLALPQLPAILDAAAARSPALAAALDLTALRTPPAEAATAAAPTAELSERSSTAAASGAAKPPNDAAAAAAAPGLWLLPQLRAAAAAARATALEAAGVAMAEAGAPLDADALLTAMAVGAVEAGGPAEATAAQRAAAAEWLAAASLLHHVEEQLGCVGGASGVRQEAVAALQLLGLPLEPQQLPYMDELRVSEQELSGWLAQLAAQLASGGGTARTGPAAAAAAVPIPAPLAQRLAVARQRLAAAGRALALTAPEPTESGAGGAGSGAASREATLAWLRAVGTPLASGLLAGGYGSLRKLRAMVPELREALVLRLLEAGRARGGAAALTAALYGDADAAWRAARADVVGAATAAALLEREAVSAELDLVHERHVSAPPATPPQRPLPSAADLAAAVNALPPPARQLYDSYYALHRDGGGGDAVVSGVREQLRVAGALAAGGENGVQLAAGDLQAWLADARKGLLVLPAPLLALLLRFLRVQVSVTPEAAQSQRNKLTALLALVAEQQRKAAEAGGGGAGGAAAEAAARELGEWSRSGGGEVAAAGGRVPAALAGLLGAGQAQDFASWLQALALTADSPSHSTHELLAVQHMEMDVERYLTMTHDPRLHLPLSGLGPPSSASTSSSTSACWTHPELRRSEASWLEGMRSQLDAYLQALGHRALGDAEWVVYRDSALAEWAAGEPAREERVAAAGGSGFFNPRADEVYLQQMLEQGIPAGDPLGPQSRRYLDTLLRNPTWNFAQRRQAVQRLVQLNAHFAAQPAAPADGSPFAPLFAVGGPELAPSLEPLGLAGGSQGGAAAAGALRLPDGF